MKARLVSVLVAAVMASAAGAQARLPIPTVGFTEWGERLPKYARGDERPPRDKETDAFLEKMSKYLVYRATGSPDERKKSLTDLEGLAANMRSGKSNGEFVNRFMPLLVARINDVFIHAGDNPDNHPALLHAAQMLPIVATVKHDAVGDFLVQLLKVHGKADKGKDAHLAAQLYAARAMREFFPPRQFGEFDPGDKDREEKKRRDLERIEALSAFITRSWPAEKLSVDAVRFMRKEAIASLAEVQLPAVVALPGAKAKKGLFADAEGSPVPTLMRVLMKGGLDPEASIVEKYHAAAGLCHLRCADVPAYQADLGIYLVGEFLLEFSLEYNKEIGLVAIKKGIGTLPWKNASENMKGHLAELVARTKGTPSEAKAKKLADAAGPMLFDMLSHRVLADSRANLQSAVSSLRPTETEVHIFKGVKAPPIKIGAK